MAWRKNAPAGLETCSLRRNVIAVLAASPAHSQLLLYGTLALPVSMAGLPLYLHAPDFYATVLLQPLAVIGTILLALRIVDAVQDPLIGAFSDKYSHRRLEIILFGMLLLMVGFVGLFNPGLAPFSERLTLAWFAVCVLVCTTGYSIVLINYQALGGLWNVPSSERTKVTGVREGFGLLGVLSASILPSILQLSYSPIHSFSIFSLLLIPMLFLGVWLFLRWYKSRLLGFEAERSQYTKPSAGLIGLANSRWGRLFYSIFFFSNLASAIPAVLVLFYVRDRLAAEQYTGLFLVIYFLSGAVGLPVWQRLSVHIGKARAWAISMMLAIATFLWAFTLAEGDIVPFAIICCLSGAALGADLAIPPAMVADRIDSIGDHHNAAQYFAANSLCAKSALALATGLALPTLGFLGYQPGQPMEEGVGLSLAMVYALFPCFIKAATAIWLCFAFSTFEGRGSAP